MHTYVLATTFTEHLGGRQEDTVFTCNTPGRIDTFVAWLHNGDELSIDGQKYMLSSTKSMLTVNDIDHNDEGSYSCKYRNMKSGPMVHGEAGCLIVYGELKPSLCTCTYI